MSESLYEAIRNKEHHKYRREITFNLCEEYSKKSLSPIERMSDRFEVMCKTEIPVILENEKNSILTHLKKFTRYIYGR